MPMNKLMRFVTGFLLLTLTLAASCGQEPTLDENENTTPSQTAVPNETPNHSENTPLPPPAVATALPTKRTIAFVSYSGGVGKTVIAMDTAAHTKKTLSVMFT